MDRNDQSSSQAVYVSIPQTMSTSKGHVAQSVIQQTQQSVIQSTAPLQAVQLSKGGLFFVKHPGTNSVIQSPAGNILQSVQVVLNNGEQIETAIENPHKRQILARRPSYKKILNDLSGGDIHDKGDAGSSDSSQDDPSGTITLGGQQYHTSGLLKVIPASNLQLSGHNEEGLQTIAMTNTSTAGNTIVHYTPGNSDGQIIVPVATSDLNGLKIASVGTVTNQGVVLSTGPTHIHGSDNMAEEATRKREIRLMKNREAARECRAKKKEYIKCLENRVAVLENQNRTLIEELKTLKALYGLNDVKE